MSGKKTYMSKTDSSQIQSSQARGGGNMSSGGFAARAQSAGDRNTNTGYGTSHSHFGGNSGSRGNSGNKGGGQSYKK